MAGQGAYLGQDLPGQCAGSVVGRVTLLVLVHSVVHQPQLVGLDPRQPSAGEDELLGQGYTQAAGQPLSASCQVREKRGEVE